MVTTDGESKNVLSGCRVLVAEDEYFLASDIVEALEAAGAEVVGPFAEVAEAAEALERGHNLHSAVLDINLRGEMVYPVAERLRQRGIPFVFTTGYDKAAIPAAFQNVPRWEKPFDAAVFASALNQPKD